MTFSYECYTCEKLFDAGRRARDSHCRATGHEAPEHECASCPRWFNSASACHQHMNDKNHFPYDCSFCDETWPTEKSCDEHEKNEHNYCSDCDRTFNNQNNLRMHLRSKIHVGQNISCPFCKRGFATATGMTNHLECGSCPNAPRLNRDQIYRLVRSKDPRGTISKNLLGWTGSSQYEATPRSWNGTGYECYLCRREFTKLSGLNQHLNSPVHQQELYHCPKCRVEFKSLAGLINHLESESCGFMRFQTVQRNVSDMIRGGRLLCG